MRGYRFDIIFRLGSSFFLLYLLHKGIFFYEDYFGDILTIVSKRDTYLSELNNLINSRFYLVMVFVGVGSIFLAWRLHFFILSLLGTIIYSWFEFVLVSTILIVILEMIRFFSLKQRVENNLLPASFFNLALDNVAIWKKFLFTGKQRSIFEISILGFLGLRFTYISVYSAILGVSYIEYFVAMIMVSLSTMSIYGYAVYTLKTLTVSSSMLLSWIQVLVWLVIIIKLIWPLYFHRLLRRWSNSN